MILKNDAENKCTLLNEVNDPFWHALILWFFEKKYRSKIFININKIIIFLLLRTNNLLGNLFHSIFEITVKYGSEKVLTNIFFKLNIFSFINEAINEIYKNNVLFSDLPIESFFHNLKKIIKVIEGTMNVRLNIL